MAQLLGIVVRRERPELEEQKDSLVRNIADGKKKLQALEDMILKYTDFILFIFLFLITIKTSCYLMCNLSNNDSLKQQL